MRHHILPAAFESFVSKPQSYTPLYCRNGLLSGGHHLPSASAISQVAVISHPLRRMDSVCSVPASFLQCDGVESFDDSESTFT